MKPLFRGYVTGLAIVLLTSVGCGDKHRFPFPTTQLDGGFDGVPQTLPPTCVPVQTTGGSHADAGETCTCPQGYQLEGAMCVFVNECLTENGGCDPNATCTPLVGTRTCACHAGFVGNGLTCTAAQQPDGGTMSPRDGGSSPVCSPPCGAHAACHDLDGAPTCLCDSGYSGDGHTCTPVSSDPCATSNGGCDKNATCSSANGAVSCTCMSGYTGDGHTCTPVATDPCMSSNGGCDPNAACTNNNGAAQCTCNQGYTGDGSTCSPEASGNVGNYGRCTQPFDCQSGMECVPFGIDPGTSICMQFCPIGDDSSCPTSYGPMRCIDIGETNGMGVCGVNCNITDAMPNCPNSTTCSVYDGAGLCGPW